ncbi:MAG: hypothetical protein R3B52_00890 [Candidatus Paceibacterota bacterium]
MQREVRVLICPDEDGLWSAVALNLNYAVSGRRFEDTRDSFLDAVQIFVAMNDEERIFEDCKIDQKFIDAFERIPQKTNEVHRLYDVIEVEGADKEVDLLVFVRRSDEPL